MTGPFHFRYNSGCVQYDRFGYYSLGRRCFDPQGLEVKDLDLNAKYLHPWLMAVFLFVFAVMSVIGMVRLIRDRRMFGSVLLLLSTVVFGYSTWIAANLKL